MKEYTHIADFHPIKTQIFFSTHQVYLRQETPPMQLVAIVWLLSCLLLILTPWIVACQAVLSIGFPRQEYWSGLPFPSLGDLPDPGIKPQSPALASGFFYDRATREALLCRLLCCAWSLSHVRLFATPWTAACQAALSMRILQARIFEQADMPSSKVYVGQDIVKNNLRSRPGPLTLSSHTYKLGIVTPNI